MLDQSEQESALAQVDALALQFIALAAPIRFDVAHSPAELEAMYRLRYRIAIERGWATPTDLPDGLERDEYDDQALHIAGWDGPTLAATVRVVFPAVGRRLPT